MEEKHDEYNVPCETDLERLIETNLMNVVSGNECTGLMPTPPLDLQEAKAYNDIYDVPSEESRVNTHPPRNKRDNTKLK